jgi:hypothetical protein
MRPCEAKSRQVLSYTRAINSNEVQCSNNNNNKNRSTFVLFNTWGGRDDGAVIFELSICILYSFETIEFFYTITHEELKVSIRETCIIIKIMPQNYNII